MRISELLVERRFQVDLKPRFGTPREVEVRSELSVPGIMAYARRAHYQSLRGLVQGNDLYVWDSNDSNHDNMTRALRAQGLVDHRPTITIEFSLGDSWVPTGQIRMESSLGQLARDDIKNPVIRALVENPRTWVDSVYYGMSPEWDSAMERGGKSRESHVTPIDYENDPLYAPWPHEPPAR